MALEKQMDLFQEGGMLDEGGTVDPVSGNEVPTGSLQEEVRDDIPAQLSEGEFVLPADVVRYHGLDKIMALRDEAKMGLQRMEEMGQMGNAEEATIPDGVPFDMEDLEIEDDGQLEMQVGGFVPATPNPFGIAGYQPSQFPQYQPQMPQVPQPQMLPQYQAPQQQFTPVATQPQQLPAFGTFMQAPAGMTPEVRTYINPQTGEERQITFVNNQPTVPIPEGFVLKSTYQAPEQPTTPTTTMTQQAQQTGGGADDRMTAEDLQKQRETQERIKARKEAAKQLGYTKEVGTLEFLASNIIPGASLVTQYEVGSVLPDGTIVDQDGNSYDPITGERKSVKGGILANLIEGVATAFGGGTAPKISPEAKAMGLNAAGIAGLRTIAGEQSIQDVIGKEAYQRITGIDLPSTGVETAKVGTAQVTAAPATTVEEAAGAPIPESKIDVKEVSGQSYITDLRNQAIDPSLPRSQQAAAAGKLLDLMQTGANQTVKDNAAMAVNEVSSIGNLPVSERRMIIEASRPKAREEVTAKKPVTDLRAAITRAAETAKPREKDTALETIRQQAADKKYSEQYVKDIKAGRYDSAFQRQSEFERDAVAEIQRSESAEIKSAAREGRKPNISSRPAGPGEVSDSRGNVVRDSQGNSVKSTSTSSKKGEAIAREREQRNADNATDSRVICTELYKQGILNTELYRMDVVYTAKHLSPVVIRGYHYWAIPTVQKMRKSTRLTKVMKYFTLKRAEEIAHIMNPTKYPKSSIMGKLIKNVGEAMCYSIGLFVKDSDYKVLYKGEKTC